MQFKIPKFGFKSKKRGNAAGFLGAKLSFISNHLSIISNKLSQNNHLSIINDKLSKKRINYKLSIFGKKLIINYKLLIAVGVLALAATGGTLALNGFFGGGAAIPEDTMTRGLVGYWSFDEGDGTIARDASGNNNHGTLTNGPQWTKGKNGTALQFDGKDDYVDCGNDASLNITNEMTIDMWVNVAKVGSSSGYDSIIGKFESNDYRRWYIQARATSYFGFYGRNDPGAYASPYNIGSFNFGEWTKLTLVLVKGVSTKAYVNGVQTYSGGCENYDLGNDGNLVIGGYAIPGALIPFHGQIDEVRIYNRALTEAEVKYHYNRGGPVAQWDMDEGSGSVINDKSGNGNDGTLVNDPTWAQGKRGSALSFDGTDDYVNCGNNSNLNISGAFTAEAWIKTTDSSAGVIISKGHYVPDNEFQFYIYGNLIKVAGHGEYMIFNSSENVWDGSWHHLVVQKDINDDGIIFVDGRQVKKAIDWWAGQSIINNKNIKVGVTDPVEERFWFNGSIDEVKIYDYARTAEEIRLDYNAGVATHLGPSGKTCSEDPAGCMDFGLAGHWDMDEGSGSILNDKSGNNNHGTLTNGPKWTQGKNGTALQFDGKDDYVDCGSGDSLNIYNALSVEAWVKPDMRKYADIVSRYSYSGPTNNGGYSLRFWDDGKFYLVTLNDSQAGISANGVVGKWNHVIATYDVNGGANNLKIYINGILAGQTTKANALKSITQNLKIGAFSYYHDGSVDGVKIYNRALSAEEVRYHYNQGKPVAQWDMDEGSGSMIKDKSGNNNDGTLVNGTTWAQGKHGTALSFDGTDDYASVIHSSSISPRGDYTYSGWFYPRNNNSAFFILKNGEYGVQWRGSTSKIAYYEAPNYNLSIKSSWNLNTWYYFSVVRNGTDLKLYIDGNLDSVSPASSKSFFNAPLEFGKFQSAFFNGQIDEVKIYDYARTEEEIRLDYNAGVATHLGPSGKTCSEDPAGCMDFGLAGHWDMDEGSGSILNDKSGNNNHGTLTNGPKWTQGKNGTALQFDGKDDYVDCGNDASLNITDEITIEAWVRHDEGGVYDGILQKGSLTSSFGKYEIHTTNDNKLRFILNGTTDNSVVTSNSIPVGLWTHIVASWDGTTIRAYINGVVDQNTDLFSGPLTTDSNPLRIGMYYSSGFIFNGQIDGVKIYNRALSAEEVRYHYNQGKPVAQWDFDEGEGTRAFDASGNNNTGVLTNGPTWVEGKHGSALSFDGVDDYVNCGTDSSLNIADSMTASAWIYPKTLGEGNAGHIVSRGGTGGWCFYVLTGNILKLYSGAGIQVTSEANSITLNQWQYATVVYDKQNVRFFVNGIEKGVTAETDSILNTGSCVIGARSSAGDFDFDGYLDGVKIYNYARTAEQIMQDYNAGLATHLK